MEIGDLKGVVAVEASPEEKTATVTFEEPATDAAIKSLLAEINYPVVD
jgi:copper chaperone CopZ